MLFCRRKLTPLEDRGPLRVMFVITCMPVGGAETLLVELIRRLNRDHFVPELCCLKYRGPLGDAIAQQVPTWTGLLAHKFDFAVLGRLRRLLRRRRIDAVVTVGTGGDKMFWGRLAAWLEGVPVICSWLHSTGLPDHVELPNRLLAPVTDAFVGVAEPHGRYLAEHEGCPASKVRVIPNGVDTQRFRPRWPNEALRESLGLSKAAPVVGIVAALRPEKRHDRFLQCAVRILGQIPAARFLIVGDGPDRRRLESLAADLGLVQSVHFLGSRDDVPELLALFDVMLLTSEMEANPVSILEAMAAEKPVVAPAVGSIGETVINGKTGVLFVPGDVDAASAAVVELLGDRNRAAAMGRAGREAVLSRWSIEQMVDGWETLLADLYQDKATGRPRALATSPAEKKIVATRR